MILQAGEQGLASESVSALSGPSLQSGYLYLTSHRIVFEGLFFEPPVGWVPRTLLDLPLVQVSNVVAVPGRKDRHTLRVEAGRGYVYTFVTPNAHGWVRSILTARGKAPAPSRTPEPSSAGIVVNVPVGSPQPSVFLHCRHCGSLAPAGSVHCSSCGATL